MTVRCTSELFGFRALLLVALLGLSASCSARVLAATPNIFTNDAYPQVDIPQACRTAQPSIFDKTPTPFKVVNGTPVRIPEAVVSYNRKGADFQAQICKQTRLADIWRFSGRHGVPIVYPRPLEAGELFGYFGSRYSGEFTVSHFKEVLSQLVKCPELQKTYIVAHSRGTNLTTTALRELTIAVVRHRLIAGQLFGGLTLGHVKEDDKEIFSEVKTLSFVNIEGVISLTGHAYYQANRNVPSDNLTIISQNAVPGSPAWPLERVEGNFSNMPIEYAVSWLGWTIRNTWT